MLRVSSCHSETPEVLCPRGPCVFYTADPSEELKCSCSAEFTPAHAVCLMSQQRSISMHHVWHTLAPVNPSPWPFRAAPANHQHCVIVIRDPIRSSTVHSGAARQLTCSKRLPVNPSGESSHIAYTCGHGLDTTSSEHAPSGAQATGQNRDYRFDDTQGSPTITPLPNRGKKRQAHERAWEYQVCTRFAVLLSCCG